MNTLLFLAAAWSFGISTALYSIVTYFSAVKSTCDLYIQWF